MKTKQLFEKITQSFFCLPLLMPGFLQMTGEPAEVKEIQLQSIQVFKVQAGENKIHINWMTGTEEQNAGFEIQRSEDGIHFSMLTWKAGNGNTDHTSQYEWNDFDVSKGTTYFYRIRQVSFTGSEKFSSIMPAQINVSNQLSAGEFNSFAGKKAGYLMIESPAKLSIQVSITDAMGKVISNESLSLNSGKNQLDFNLNPLSKGIYFAAISDGKQEMNRKIVVGE